MNKLMNYRRFMLTGLSILSLWATLGSSAPVMAARTTNDISIKIVADRDVVMPGQKVTYTVTATNLGPDDAAFVDTVFQIPDQLVVVSITCDQSISPDGPFCEYSSLPSGSSVVSTFVATPKPAAHGRDKTVSTSASISFETTDTFDPNTRNNRDAVKTKVTGKLSHR